MSTPTDSAKSPRRKAPTLEPAAPATPSLRFTGQAPTVFFELGGEITPGQVVPADEGLSKRLIARGDFELAAPADGGAPEGTDTP